MLVGITCQDCFGKHCLCKDYPFNCGSSDLLSGCCTTDRTAPLDTEWKLDCWNGLELLECTSLLIFSWLLSDVGSGFSCRMDQWTWYEAGEPFVHFWVRSARGVARVGGTLCWECEELAFDVLVYCKLPYVSCY